MRGTAKLQMVDQHARIVNHAEPGLPDPHAQIDLLVIGRAERLVEAAEPLQKRGADQQEHRRTVIDIADEIRLGASGEASRI